MSTWHGGGCPRGTGADERRARSGARARRGSDGTARRTRNSAGRSPSSDGQVRRHNHRRTSLGSSGTRARSCRRHVAASSTASASSTGRAPSTCDRRGSARRLDVAQLQGAGSSRRAQTCWRLRCPLKSCGAAGASRSEEEGGLTPGMAGHARVWSGARTLGASTSRRRRGRGRRRVSSFRCSERAVGGTR